MISVKKEFQELKFRRNFLKKEIGAYNVMEYIHKYDRQRLKSLLDEQLKEKNKEYKFVYE